MYKLYLDDIRTPKDTYPHTTLGEWIIVRNYDEFVNVIEKLGLPFMVSFDHDLAHEHYRQSMYNPDRHYTNYYTDGTFKEKTGFEAAKWLVEYCMNHNLSLPKWNVHSANPIGAENIESYLLSYEKSTNEKTKL